MCIADLAASRTLGTGTRTWPHLMCTIIFSMIELYVRSNVGCLTHIRKKVTFSGEQFENFNVHCRLGRISDSRHWHSDLAASDVHHYFFHDRTVCQEQCGLLNSYS